MLYLLANYIFILLFNQKCYKINLVAARKYDPSGSPSLFALFWLSLLESIKASDWFKQTNI